MIKRKNIYYKKKNANLGKMKNTGFIDCNILNNKSKFVNWNI